MLEQKGFYHLNYPLGKHVPAGNCDYDEYIMHYYEVWSEVFWQCALSHQAILDSLFTSSVLSFDLGRGVKTVSPAASLQRSLVLHKTPKPTIQTEGIKGKWV